MLLKALWIKIFNILISIHDSSYIWIVESLHELNDGGLSATTSSYESYSSILLNFNRSFVNDLNILLGWILEFDVSKLDGTLLNGSISNFLSTGGVDL